MANINKDWIDAPQNAEEYIKGVENFLELAFLNSTMGLEEDDEPKILCPCTKCVNRFWFTREVVFDHLIAHRFNKRYKVWNFHGEGLTAGSSSRGGGHQCDNQNTLDNMGEMINDIFRDVMGGSTSEAEGIHKGLDESAKKFFKLLEDAKEELYPERYLGKLKSYVKNRSRPEGSIAEAYMAEECLIFCSRYLHDDFSSKLNRAPRNDDDIASNEDGSLFPSVGRPLGVKKKNKGKKVSLYEDTLMKAHLYVLFNCDEISDYISEHQDLVNRQRSQGRRGKRSRWARAQEHIHDIGAWFKDRVREENVSKKIKALSQGPDYTVRSFRVPNKWVQNPVVGDVKYYGVVEDIIELDYFGHFKVALFRCNWFQVEQDEFGLTCANFKRLCYTNDPFVMDNQVNQVFYVQDSKEKHLHYVMETIPGDFFDMSEESNGDVGVSYLNESASDGVRLGETVADDYDVLVSLLIWLAACSCFPAQLFAPVISVMFCCGSSFLCWFGWLCLYQQAAASNL
uniref:Transposase-associated domain-containing protein n=1 Tax=Chenopodium quinoa TaxID=63459 RepID=A0A803LSF2_CHEQI